MDNTRAIPVCAAQAANPTNQVHYLPELQPFNPHGSETPAKWVRGVSEQSTHSHTKSLQIEGHSPEPPLRLEPAVPFIFFLVLLAPASKPRVRACLPLATALSAVPGPAAPAWQLPSAVAEPCSPRSLSRPREHPAPSRTFPAAPLPSATSVIHGHAVAEGKTGSGGGGQPR